MKLVTPQTRTMRVHFPRFADIDPSDDNIDYLVDTFRFTQGDDLPEDIDRSCQNLTGPQQPLYFGE